jgi:hypothetical protein
MGSYAGLAARGAVAGILGSVIQTGVGLALDKLLLPPRHPNNIAPRLIKRLAQWTGRRGSAPRDWTLGTLFHLGYGAGWGVLLGLLGRLTGVSPLPLGGIGGALVYLAAFSSRGVGTLTGTEPPPRLRDWRKQVSLVAVSSTFALATASLNDRLARRS